jgi:hypothetical protein
MPPSDFAVYRKTTIAHARPYVVGEDLTGVITSPEALEGGSPKEGDMIVRDPMDHLATQVLVTAQYFRNNYELA